MQGRTSGTGHTDRDTKEAKKMARGARVIQVSESVGENGDLVLSYETKIILGSLDEIKSEIVTRHSNLLQDKCHSDVEKIHFDY